MADIERMLRRLKLSDLRLLQATVEWGGMAKAAAHLNISQPAVSKAIGTLEHALGVRLLDRTSKGVEPTEFGQALLNGGIAVFDELKKSLGRIEFLSDPNAGQVRIGCSEAGAAGFVPAVIDRFSRRRPRVVFQIITADPVTLIERELPQRAIDLAICAVPRLRSVTEFEVAPLFEDKHVVMASKRSTWSRLRRMTLNDLAEEAWVLPPSTSEPGRLIVDAFRRANVEPPQRLVSAFSIPLCLHLLATGRYVAMLPQVMAQLSAHLPLKVLPVTIPEIARPIGIVTLKGRSVGPLTKLFIDCAREAAAGLGR
jgi:DNA-binding transcriptional LysR family regulator